jgi:D-alanyl-D-alanine carboxypeptidase
MVVRPLMSGFVGGTALLLVLAVQSPAYAQADGRSAQIVVDAETNEVLYENNAQASRRPASITKVMTLYLLFDALKRGSITWDERIVFSRNASNQPPTKLFVSAGNSIPVQTAVEALVLRSANDVATAVAERLGGSESNFAQMMTNKARELGMSSTTFRNASGLPNATQRTTAEDLARLAIAIHRDFPDQYHWFSAQQMSWNGQTITGHNHLMGRMPGMDGLKTGYTSASGFNLAATTQRDGRRIVTVVLGGANRFVRDDLVEALTESAFRELGIGGTQFAANTSAYDVNFRDSRDAADAAALFMDLPARRITTGGATTIAMSRSGRRLGFARGAPTFQVADMTRPAPTLARSTINRSASAAPQEESDTGATDEGESDVTRPIPNSAPVPVPFRVAIAPSAASTPARKPPGAATVPTRVPVVFPNSAQPVRPEPAITPLRQLAQTESTIPVPVPTLRGSLETETPASRGEPSEAAPPQAVPTQMAASEPEKVIQAATSETTVAEASMPNTIGADTTNSTVMPQQTETKQVAQTGAEVTQESAQPESKPLTQMAELAKQDAASLASNAQTSATPQPNTELNGSINLAEATSAPAIGQSETTSSATQSSEAAPVQMASLESDAVAQAQRRQAEANEREQIRIAEAQAIEDTRREAARVQAAAAARVLAERQANERRAERQLAEARAKALKEKEVRDLALAERQAAQERAVAAREEERRQAEATRARNARGTAIVQVGAFKDKKDANAAIAQFSRFFPSFAQTEVSSVSRRDGVWYRARFAGLGALAASEACRLVSGRGGACEIVGR